MHESDSASGSAYVRHPTIRGDRIAFSAEGDLWEADAGGGDARRMTSSAAVCSFPRYSPDGKYIAFSSADEGPPAVWVMPAGGGPARRLTFHATPDQVVGWSLDSEHVVFRTLSVVGIRAFTLARVPVGGGAVEGLSYGRGTGIAYHADGDRVALHRHGGDPAWWKRYAGGRAGRLWIGRHSTGEFEPVPGGPRTDACPMWIGDQLWFLSDQDGMGDIWCADADGSHRRRVTSHDAYFARHPEQDAGRIVYSMGGRLMLLDTNEINPEPREIPVSARGHSVTSRRKFVSAADGVESHALSFAGSTALFSIRGRVAALPCWGGAARIIAAPDGVRFRCARPLGNTGRFAAIAQWDENSHVVLIPEDGIGNDMSRATDLGHVGRRIRAIEVSPDGKRIAVLDQGRGVHVMTLSEDGSSAETVMVDDDGQSWVRRAAWSPCGTWLAYARQLTWWSSHLFLWNVVTGERTPLSTGEFSDAAPDWDPAGRFLAFLSARELDPVYSAVQHDFEFVAPTRAYAIALRKGERLPFAAEAELPPKEVEPVTEPLAVDLDGIQDRVAVLPFKPGNLTQVLCATSGVGVVRYPTVGAHASEDEQHAGPNAKPAKLEILDHREREVQTAVDGMSGASASGDAKRWIVRAGKRFRVIDAAKSREENPFKKKKDTSTPSSGWLDLGRVRFHVTPRAEFGQILREAWSLQRDHFYDEGLVSVDWDACLERYSALLPRIRTREELIDLLWEMQGELGTSHAYAFGGDVPAEKQYSPGLLGCDFAQDGTTGAYRIDRIYRGDPWQEKQHSPLAAAGVEVSEGDWLLAVDGLPVGRETHPGERLLERAGRSVVLRLAASADGADARDVTVTPTRDETLLRYRAWVDDNERRVSEASDGRVGYIHIPNMGPWGATEFHRTFLWQVIQKRALVVDARYNGGGNISAILLAKLMRPIIGWTFTRYGGARTYPSHAPLGPIVVLTNENAGSDGDIFSQAVKSVSLGPLIGMRTWGGVVGIDMAKTLVDGGQTSQPEYAFWFPGVGWSVENHGVEPDIEVDLTPADALRGADPQLDRAIHEVLTRLEATPPVPPDPGPLPNLRHPA